MLQPSCPGISTIPFIPQRTALSPPPGSSRDSAGALLRGQGMTAGVGSIPGGGTTVTTVGDYVEDATQSQMSFLCGF